MVRGRRLNRYAAPVFRRPIAVPSWKPRLRTWVVRIVRKRGWSSAYSDVGKKWDIMV